jgi:eukaryotic-like serine/threonine-protein kinase
VLNQDSHRAPLWKQVETWLALKFLPHELTRDSEARERFVQEAQSASALDHPNICTIYDVDTADDGQLFIAMAYYDGETLKQRLRRRRLTPAEALDAAIQVCRGLDKAHHAGIVHRDIKPANLMITGDGLVKIVDFGIAKLLAHTGPTRTGTTLGTVAYMAPEQVRGSEFDQRVDLWALGVVLYEMVTGVQPFGAENDAVIINRIFTHDPAPIRAIRPDAPARLDAVIRRALAKEPEQRFATAAEFLHELTDVHASVIGQFVTAAPAEPGIRRRTAVIAAIFLLAAVGLAGGWLLKRNADQRRVETLIQEATSFAAKDQNVAALAALERVEQLVAADPRVTALSERVAVRRTIKSDPPAARVYGKEYTNVDGEWTLFGETPITDYRFPRAMMRWKVEKAGSNPLEFISPAPAIPLAGMDLRLQQTGTVPSEMVQVNTPRMALTLSGYDYSRSVPGRPFLIDKHEVTNRQFKAFVDAGGYTKREYWRQPFVKDGRTLSWEEAVTLFRDRTGRPGPSTWEVGTYPAGHDDDPVGGVSWYEAVAYAAFAGKSLPTVYHWVAAATIGAAAYVTPLSNFAGKGPAAVGAYRGVTAIGAYDMAGNVKEWCWNEITPGTGRYILGGSWTDPPHMFSFADARSPFDREEVNGFRLVKYLDENPLPETVTAAIEVPTRDFTKEHPVSDEVFRAYRGLYAYDPRPLDAKSEGKDDTGEQWSREKVSFTAAYGNERVTAYLFLPKTGRPPYQTVVFAPGAGAMQAQNSDNQPLPNFDFLLMSGRAVIAPVFQGMYERNTGQSSPWPSRTRTYQDWIVQVVMDARRVIDYVATRDDLAHGAVAYYGVSWGGMIGSMVLAVEPRYRVGVLTDTGLTPSTAKPPEVDQFNFAPRVAVPVLMVTGDSDYIYQLEMSQKPLFALLGTPADRKKHVVFHAGHFVLNPQRSQVVKEILDWLDRYLGPVNG